MSFKRWRSYLYPVLLCLCQNTAAEAQERYAVDTVVHKDNHCPERIVAYFQLKGKYPESPRILTQKADSAIAPVRDAGINGYITYQLLIDCKGLPAAFRLLQTDAQYQPAAFPKATVDALYFFVKGLKNWKPGHARDEDLYYKAYLSFKIRNGHVVEVSP